MISLRGLKEREEFLAVSLSLGLAIIKGAASFWTGTLSLFASALDSLLDFFISGLNLLSLSFAQKQADEDHTFGHEKAEPLAGFFQSLVIFGSAVYLVYSSIHRLTHPVEARNLSEGIGVLAVSMGASFWLSRRLRRSAATTGSVVLKTDSLHYAMDLYTQSGLLAAFVVLRLTGWRWVDPVVTLPIALYIALQAFRIGREAVDELMDREASPTTLQRVREIVSRYAPEVVGMHNFKARHAAGKRFIQFHAEMKKDLKFEEVHEITERIVKEIRDTFKNAQVIVHPDPEGRGVDESDLM